MAHQWIQPGEIYIAVINYLVLIVLKKVKSIDNKPALKET